MHVRTYTLEPGQPLSRDLREAWVGLREGVDALASPYLDPGYVEAVAATSPAPVRLIVAGRDTVEAILAVQGGRTARAAGAPMSDYCGIIGQAPVEALLAGAGISVLPVTGWVNGTDALSPTPVCRMDLRQGPEAWREGRDGSYRRHVKSTKRRARKAEREVGEISFELLSRDAEVFDTLIAWKRSQFAATSKFDVLDGWPTDLLRRLWERGSEDLRVDLHAVRIGDRLAAIDLGLADGRTYHSWIVAYDPGFSVYGPGMQIMEALIDEAPRLGYGWMDFGTMAEGGIKKSYADEGMARVGTGTLRTRGARAHLSKVYGDMETRLEPLARLRRRYAQISAVEPRLSARARALGKAVVANARG